MKKYNSEYTIDLTNVTGGNDLYFALADAKCDKHLTIGEYSALMQKIIDDCGIKICICQDCPTCETAPKKENIFKRFLKWLKK